MSQKEADAIGKAWPKVDGSWTRIVRNAKNEEVGTLSLHQTLEGAKIKLGKGTGLTVYNNARGTWDKTKNDVKLPQTTSGGTFYEFDMVDTSGKQIFVDGRRHGFRVVIEVDARKQKNTPQVAWLSTAHYGVGDNQNKDGWFVVKEFGEVGSMI